LARLVLPECQRAKEAALAMLRKWTLADCLTPVALEGALLEGKLEALTTVRVKMTAVVHSRRAAQPAVGFGTRCCWSRLLAGDEDCAGGSRNA
jgi:uncharacterized membrane protein